MFKGFFKFSVVCRGLRGLKSVVCLIKGLRFWREIAFVERVLNTLVLLVVGKTGIPKTKDRGPKSEGADLQPP